MVVPINRTTHYRTLAPFAARIRDTARIGHRPRGRFASHCRSQVRPAYTPPETPLPAFDGHQLSVKTKSSGGERVCRGIGTSAGSPRCVRMRRMTSAC